MPGLLDGIRVVDLSSYVAGPAGAAILADLGADVIHVEPLNGDPFRSLTIFHGIQVGEGKAKPEQINSGFELDNRNKRSIAVALNSPHGRQIVHDLVRDADVLLTNLLPERLTAIKLEYDQAKAINPRLIYAALTGYGPNNDERDRRAFDHTAFWARAGLMETISEGASEKPYLRAGMGDQAAGMALAGAIGLALYAREKTGAGQRVDVSLFRTGLWVMGHEIQRQLTYGATVPHGPRVEPVNPMTNYYRAGDGKWLMIHMSFTEKFWPRLCETLGRPEWIEDPRFHTHAARSAHAADLVRELDQAFATAPRDEWGRRLDALGVVWSPIQTLAEVEQDPLLDQESIVYDTTHPSTGRPYRLLNIPFTFSNYPSELRSTAPHLGAHTDQVLAEIGYDEGKIGQLRGEGVIK